MRKNRDAYPNSSIFIVTGDNGNHVWTEIRQEDGKKRERQGNNVGIKERTETQSSVFSSVHFQKAGAMLQSFNLFPGTCSLFLPHFKGPKISQMARLWPKI